MNLHLNRFRKKAFLYPAAFIFFIILLAALNPLFKNSTLDTLRHPLKLLTLIQREAAGIIFYHRNLIQNERLKRENDLLKARLNAADDIYAQNRRLKDLLSFKESSPYKVIAARVIGHSADNWSSMAIIDKGNYHGIRRGLVVITPVGLVGRIIEATKSSAKVMLINDPNIGISSVVSRSRQEGLVSGTLGRSLIMKYLPRDCDIKPSDTIVTSGLTDMYPKGLLIGTVMSLHEEFSGLSRYAIIKPAVQLSNIEEVLIIIP